jgi:hypothetical protein
MPDEAEPRTARAGSAKQMLQAMPPAQNGKEGSQEPPERLQARDARHAVSKLSLTHLVKSASPLVKLRKDLTGPTLLEMAV